MSYDKNNVYLNDGDIVLHTSFEQGSGLEWGMYSGHKRVIDTRGRYRDVRDTRKYLIKVSNAAIPVEELRRIREGMIRANEATERTNEALNNRWRRRAAPFNIGRYDAQFSRLNPS